MPSSHPILDRPTQTRRSPYSRGEWTLLDCAETGLVYLENPPAYESLADDFAWEQTFEAERERRRAEEPVLSKMSEAWKEVRTKRRKVSRIVRLLHEILDTIPRVDHPVAVLDIGCGDGHILTDAIAADPADAPRLRPLGIEISHALARESTEAFEPLGGRVVQQSGPEGVKAFAADQPEIVLMNSYLEHEVRPRELLLALHEHLPVGARLLIKVPNYASWNRKVRGERWCGFRFPDHVNYFSPENLKLLLETTGFALERMRWSDRLPTSDNFYAIARRPA
jgi:SAM-dependent methyltransferase